MNPEKPISLRTDISDKDFPQIAEQIVQIYRDRKEERKDLEKNWKEIDRQLAMTPELSHKKTPGGGNIEGLEWLPEIELPLQAQTLEVLLGDVTRFKFPRDRDWFRASAAMTQTYIEKYQSVETPFPGERGPDLGKLTQDDVNRLAQAIPSHFHRQYDFRGHMARIDVDALKYGFGVGRVKRVNTRILGHSTRTTRDQRIPMLVPRSAKHVYLDDSIAAVMHEGEVIGPNIIQCLSRRLEDVKVAAKNDSSYIQSQVANLVPDKQGNVTLVELEGDLVYSTSQDTIVVKNVVLTAAYGEQGSYGLIREQKGDGSTYIVFDYHKESSDARYATAPLMKGLPIQKMGSQVMNQLIASGQLSVLPPIGFDRDDPSFAAEGGPRIAPGAQWPTASDLQIHSDVGGDPQAFFNIFAGLNSLYNDVTGGHPARLGAQTKSHTTAFAKEAELSQGSVRTVDYVEDTLLAPMTQLLNLEYRMGLEDWRKQTVYIEAWDTFAELQRAHLPDLVIFKAVGAGASAEDQAKLNQKLAAVQFAMQVDAIAVQLGREPRLDHAKIIDKVLEEAGFADVTEVVSEEEAEPVQDAQLPGVLSADPGLLQ